MRTKWNEQYPETIFKKRIRAGENTDLSALKRSTLTCYSPACTMAQKADTATPAQVSSTVAIAIPLQARCIWCICALSGCQLVCGGLYLESCLPHGPTRTQSSSSLAVEEQPHTAERTAGAHTTDTTKKRRWNCNVNSILEIDLAILPKRLLIYWSGQEKNHQVTLHCALMVCKSAPIRRKLKHAFNSTVGAH